MLPIDPAGGQSSPPIVSPQVVPPQAIAYGGTIIRPGAVAWGGMRDAAGASGIPGGRPPVASGPSCEAVERALAATLRNPGSLPELIAELAPARLWVPLPVRGRRFTDGTAVRLPVIGYTGADFVPCFTSVQRLSAWAEADLRRTGDLRRAGDVRMAPHVVLPATGLARRLPYGLGLAVNPDTVPGLPLYPECVSLLARLSDPGPLAMERAVDVAGVRFLIGHPPVEPTALLTQARAALAAVPAVREAARAWLSFPGGEGLLIAAVLDDPASDPARSAAADAIGRAAAAVPLRVPYPLDVAFPGEPLPGLSPAVPVRGRHSPAPTALDAVNAWIAENTRPFYTRQ